MANLYLTKQNSILQKSGDRFIVQKDDETLLDVRCHKIDAVLIFGNIQFTTQTGHELFQHGREMAILTRTGKLIGQITSPTPKNLPCVSSSSKNTGIMILNLSYQSRLWPERLRTVFR